MGNGLKYLEIVVLRYTIGFIEDVSIDLNKESMIGTITTVSCNLSTSCSSESVIFKLSIICKLESINCDVESIS